MLTPDEILELAKSKAVDFRKWENESKSGRKSDYPDYTPVYADTVKMAEHIAIHAETDTFPTALFQKKRPNESQEQFDYIKTNYKPTTRAYWNRALNVLNRIWNTQNYHIDWKTDEENNLYKDETAFKYFTEDYPLYKSILHYFESIVTRHKVNDPNAILCIKPYYIPTKANEEGELVLNDTELIKPVAVIYGSEQLVDFKENFHCLVLLKEKSDVEYGNSTVHEGLIFEYYDNERIYRIVQTGKKVDNKFEATEYYIHNLGFVPCQKLKGNPIQLENDVFYKSIFSDAVPCLDTALVHSQTLEASIIANAYKQYWEYVDKCEGTLENQCDNGWVGFGDEKRKCSECNGTGKTNKRSILGAIQLITPDRLNDGDTQLPNPPAGYIEENTTILDFLDSYIDKQVIRAFSMLNIDISESNVKGSETALGKQIDREELFSMLLTFSNETFALLKFTLNTIGTMRYLKDFIKPEINPPSDFAIRSEYDLTEELGKAKESGTPKAALRYITMQYIRQRCNSETLIKREDLRLSVDSLATEDAMTIIASVGANIVPKWKAVLHNEFDIYLDSLLAEDKDFLNKPLAEQSKTLIERAKAEAKELRPEPMNPEGIIAKIAS